MVSSQSSSMHKRSSGGIPSHPIHNPLRSAFTPNLSSPWYHQKKVALFSPVYFPFLSFFLSFFITKSPPETVKKRSNASIDQMNQNFTPAKNKSHLRETIAIAVPDTPDRRGEGIMQFVA